VSKTQLTQFGRAMKHLGIQMMSAYSPEARGRSERAFLTHQDRLSKELAFQGITDIPWIGTNLDDILCQHEERTVNADNCACVDSYKLQIPANQYRCHYVRVMVHRYRDGSLAIFHGPRKLMEVKPRKAA
jgi:hypothetical protein